MAAETGADRGSGRSARSSCPAELRDAAAGDDRHRAGLAAGLGQGADRVERRFHPAGRGLVGDDVEDGVPVARLLHEPRHRDLLVRELLRDPRQHAGPVLDLEPEVER